MRRTAHSNFAAFDKIDRGAPGFHAQFSSAAKNSFHFSIDDADAHRPLHGDGFAFDYTDGLFNRLVGGRAKRNHASARKRGGEEPAKHLRYEFLRRHIFEIDPARDFYCDRYTITRRERGGTRHYTNYT